MSAINPLPNKPLFLCVYRTSLLKTLWEKEKLLGMRTFCHFHWIPNCCLQTCLVWKSLKSIVWERVKKNTHKHSFWPTVLHFHFISLEKDHFLGKIYQWYLFSKQILCIWRRSMKRQLPEQHSDINSYWLCSYCKTQEYNLFFVPFLLCWQHAPSWFPY